MELVLHLSWTQHLELIQHFVCIHGFVLFILYLLSLA